MVRRPPRIAPAQISCQATSAAAKKSRRVLLAFTLTLPAGLSRARLCDLPRRFCKQPNATAAPDASMKSACALAEANARVGRAATPQGKEEARAELMSLRQSARVHMSCMAHVHVRPRRSRSACAAPAWPH